MCGINGLFAYNDRIGDADIAALRRARDYMLARGPDAKGEWFSDDRRFGLLHRRLSIIDLSEAGSQPMLDPDTGNRIVFNGEIYNYKDLKASLEREGHRFRSTSDTEVLLKLYAARGRDMLFMLRGMFAFAMWDEDKQKLLLARDPFGIKPLYVADDGKSLRFASQVKALLAGGSVDTAPSPAGHAGFYLWGAVPEPYTLYKGIRALPAGSSLWVDGRGARKPEPYFNLADEFSNADQDRSPVGAREARERLRAALFDSVRRHMVADVPVGVFLSAGLDSICLAALAKEASSDEVNAVTVGFNEYARTARDETPLAADIARRLGVRHEIEIVTTKDFAESFTRIVEAMDQPSIDGVNSYFVSLAARRRGLKVALSGLGGDELFAGYSGFEEIPRLLSLARPFARVPGLGRSFRIVSERFLKRFTSPKYAGLIEYGGDYAGCYLLRRGLFMPWELPKAMDAELAFEGLNELQTLPALRRTMGALSDPRFVVSALEMSWYMRNQLLRDADWASMAHSLEVRVPLVDVDLLRVVVSLARAGYAPFKRDMAECVAPFLPKDVLDRPKTGFSIPVREWLMDMAPVRGRGQFEQRGLRRWALALHSHAVGAAIQ
jgi:asparagine synthase (glutamine-hydrolysing)